MNKTFEEQVKNQVQYPEYDRNKELQETKQKLQETKEKINNMKNIISKMKKELIDINFKEKNVKKQMMGKIGNLLTNLN
tara:strand:+ start:15 stop:251 length:237 start_codon:yes stop_codon:yes gene_type:complete